MAAERGSHNPPRATRDVAGAQDTPAHLHPACCALGTPGNPPCSSHCQQCVLPNQQQHPQERSKANIPELLSSSLIRGCLSEKTFIIPALKNTLLSSLVFFNPPKKAASNSSPASPAAQLIPALVAPVSAPHAKSTAVLRSCVAAPCTPTPALRRGRGVLAPLSPAHLARPTGSTELLPLARTEPVLLIAAAKQLLQHHLGAAVPVRGKGNSCSFGFANNLKNSLTAKIHNSH